MLDEKMHTVTIGQFGLHIRRIACSNFDIY